MVMVVLFQEPGDGLGEILDMDGRGVEAVPLTNERTDDHADQPVVLPARARQYHRLPSFGKPLHVFDVPLNSLPLYGLVKAASRLTWLWYLVAPGDAFHVKTT
jgi:hypothetical protein